MALSIIYGFFPSLWLIPFSMAHSILYGSFPSLWLIPLSKAYSRRMALRGGWLIMIRAQVHCSMFSVKTSLNSSPMTLVTQMAGWCWDAEPSNGIWMTYRAFQNSWSIVTSMKSLCIYMINIIWTQCGNFVCGYSIGFCHLKWQHASIVWKTFFFKSLFLSTYLSIYLSIYHFINISIYVSSNLSNLHILLSSDRMLLAKLLKVGAAYTIVQTVGLAQTVLCTLKGEFTFFFYNDVEPAQKMLRWKILLRRIL